MNLTPHEVTIVDSKQRRYDIVSHGLARVTVSEENEEPIGDIPVIVTRDEGIVVGLPEPVSGIAFLVSREVLRHPDVVGRKDVFAPATRPRHNPFYDEHRRIIGVTRLIAASPKS
jgi:hypothetical protein